MATENNTGDRSNGRWTKEEHEKFLLGLQLYGKNWKKIEELVVTRNGSQIRSHAQKYFLKTTSKGSNLDESNENQDPRQLIACLEQNPKKSNNLGPKFPSLDSSEFWSKISSLVSDPTFSLWELIDHPSESSEKSTQVRKFSEEISEEPEDRALRNITKNLQSTMNESRSFYIFSPLENMHLNY